MYLKRLEIQGFKSFADKVEIEFNSGITAVVGPNGSGKSNIVDAIRWVLGEQSAKTLRGLRMDDIIFSGSFNRRPVGMAQVSLTLDNSTGIFPLEFNEVTVTRRLYRSGESEYLINKVLCRMKDIHELFMDTGLGKEGFSVIGQGKIDEILSLKAEDRRNLIEEAAGIVKYRYRKRDTQRKLGDTDQSLVRINDLIMELNEQLGPLEQQAQKARQFHNWKKELDQWELSIAVQAIEDNKVKEVEMAEVIQKLEDDLTETSTQYHQLESNIENFRFELQRLDQHLSNLQQSYYNYNSELERKEHQVEMSKERKAGLIAQIKRIDSELENLKNEQTNLHSDILNKQQELKHLELEYGEALNLVQKLSEAINQHKKEFNKNSSLLEEYKSQVIETLQEKAKANNEVIRLDNEINVQNRRYQQMDEKLEKIKELVAETEKQLNIYEKEKAKAMNEKNEFELKVRNFQNDLEKKILEQNQTKKRLEEHQINYQQIKSRLQVLKEMEESGEGYQQGVRVVLEAKRNKLKDFKGIIGTVADIIKVPKHLEVAIETSLGGALQHIITENDEGAQKAINFLKAKKKGRATFLPLNTIKAKANTTKLNDSKVLGRAVELVNYEPKYNEIIEYLLGKIWIVNDLASAVAIGKKSKFSFRMVTLEGEIITPGGSLTGGSYSKQRAGLLTRKRLIKELSENLLKAQNEVEKFKKQLLSQETEQQRLVEEISQSKDLLQEKIIRISEVENRREQVLQELKRINSERDIILLDQNELKQQVTILKAEKKKQIGEVQKITTRDQSIQQTINELQINLKEIAVTQDDLSEQLNEKKIITATLKQAKDMGHSRYSELEQRLNDLEKEKIKLTSEKNQLQAQVGELEKLVEISEDEIIRLNKTLEKYQRDMEKFKEKRGAVQQSISSLEQEIKSKQLMLEQLKNNKYQADLKLSKFEMEIEASKEKLKQQFNCTYEDARGLKQEISNKRNVMKRINELKAWIDDLGLVNFAAIDEYERVDQRLKFLSKQYNDLQKAKNSLVKVIKEMDQIMIKKFKETFSLVNDAFNSVFVEMFGGGSANLELSDNENLLDTGIEIIAQPPGKKPQSLSLLSGGERAMTAIALLFAILKVKPSPFCILDEIEAALDEANVGKFAYFLRDFAQKTQFIVISHRKGTMEAADALYGVTIEDTGVSKLISVRLSDVTTIGKVS